MLAHHYDQIKKIYKEIGKAGAAAIINAKAQEQQRIKAWEVAEAEETAKKAEIMHLQGQIEQEEAKTSTAQTDAPIERANGGSGEASINAGLISALEQYRATKATAEAALPGLAVARAAAREQADTATQEHQRIKAAVEAMAAALQERVMPYFNLLDRAGLIPPIDSLLLRGSMGAASVGAAAIVSGVAAYGTTSGGMTEALALSATAATALGTTTALTLHPEVFRHLQMAGLVTPVTFLTNAVFTPALTGSLDRESFNAGVAPFLLALWVLDVLGVPVRDGLLARSSLPNSANLLLKVILSVALVLAAVTLGPGLLGGAPSLADTLMFPALPFAAAITTKILADAEWARRRALAYESTAMVVIDPASLNPTERANYNVMVVALRGLNAIVGTELQEAAPAAVVELQAKLTMVSDALAMPAAPTALPAGAAVPNVREAHVAGFGAPQADILPAAAATSGEAGAQP